jgi:hypothetical protein
VTQALANLRSYRVLRGVIHRASGASAGAEGQPLVPRVPLTDYKQCIADLDALCRCGGARLILISFPLSNEHFKTPVDIERANTWREYRAAMGDVARERGIPFLRLRALTEESETPNVRLFPEDAFHPSAEGHRIIAECLAEFLKAEHLVGE